MIRDLFTRLRTALLATVLAFAATTAHAATTDVALAFVTDLGGEAVRIVSDPALKTAEFESKFRAFIDRGFDVDTLGRFALGPSAKSLTPAQMTEYQKLFYDYIVKTYASRFKQYSGEQFKVGVARAVGTDEALVASEIIRPKAASIKVDWQVRVADGQPKIIDVVFEGLRLGVTLRDEFAGVLRQGGGNADALLKVLRDRAAQAAAGTPPPLPGAK